MNKQAIIDKLIEKLEAERKTLFEAARNTYEAATHEESEAEDQYDTRGLEASYLAGAQAKRVADVEQAISVYKQLVPKKFTDSDPIGSTALVELDHDGKITHVLLLPLGGGMSLMEQGKQIQVISPQSPIGEALVGRLPGDVAIVDKGDETREYEIVSVV
jgi:transcription elongation GreA/GreB family factor